MIYAEIDENKKCFVVSDFSDATIEKDTLIPLDSYDTSILGKIWTGSEWIEDENDPLVEETIAPSNDEIQVSILLNQMEIIANQETILQKLGE